MSNLPATINTLHIMASAQNARSLSKERLTANRNKLLKKLRAIKATHAVIEYCGAGDSGAIEQVFIYTGDTEIKPQRKIQILSSRSVRNQDDTGWIDELKPQLVSLRDAIEYLVYDWLEFEHGGWENGDGASGECRINVKEGTFTLGHNIYYNESDYSEHSL